MCCCPLQFKFTLVDLKRTIYSILNRLILLTSEAVGLDVSVSQCFLVFNSLYLMKFLLFSRGESPVAIEYGHQRRFYWHLSWTLSLVFKIFLTLNVEAAIQTTLTTKTSISLPNLNNTIVKLYPISWPLRPNCFLAPGSSSTRHVIQIVFEKRCRPVKPQRGVVLLSFAQTMEWMSAVWD